MPVRAKKVLLQWWGVKKIGEDEERKGICSPCLIENLSLKNAVLYIGHCTELKMYHSIHFFKKPAPLKFPLIIGEQNALHSSYNDRLGFNAKISRIH